jgi:hypothetical protein
MLYCTENLGACENEKVLYENKNESFFFFWQYWGLNSGVLPPEATPPAFLCWVFSR